MSYTPGPWEWHEWYGEYGICTSLGVEHPKGMPIARVYYSEADARLIAAAPKMLELLKEARNEFLEADYDAPVVDSIEELLFHIGGEGELEDE